MGAGIGFGKAGNNPYQWLALGGAGLQSMLAGSPTNDPSSLRNEQFLRAAADTGQAQPSIPRDVHGLLPMLMQKIGILSPTVQASPDQMHMQNLFVKAQQQQQQVQKLSEMVKFLDVVNAALKQSPEWAAKVYSSFPSMETPGITPADIASLKTLPEDKLEQQRQAEEVRSHQAQERIEQGRIKTEQAEQRIIDAEEKSGSGGEADRRARFGQYQAMLRARLRNPMTGEIDPAAQKAYDNTLRIQNSGGEVSDAIRENEAIFNPPQQPVPVSSGWGPDLGLGNLLSRIVSLRLGASPATGAPTNAPPQARPTVVPKVAPSW